MFSTIIQRHGLQADYLPIWKIINVMDENDVNNLNDYIPQTLGRNAASIYGKEIILLVAYWYQRIYEGGQPSISNILLWLNRNNDERNRGQWLRTICTTINDKKKSWRIQVPRGQHNTNWLDAALALGGIPISQLQNNNNTQRWIGYLQRLYNYYDVVIKPTDEVFLNYAEREAMGQFPAYYAVASFCTELIKDISLGNNTYNVYEQIRTIYGTLIEYRNNTPNRVNEFFKVIWELKEDNTPQLEVSYSIICPQRYRINTEEGYNQILLNGEKTIAKYYDQQYTGNMTMQWEGNVNHILLRNNSFLYLEKLKDNDVSEKIPVPLNNSDVPEFDIPCILYQDSDNPNYWLTENRHRNTQQRLLCPQQWHICNQNVQLQNCQTIQINGNDYYWFNIDWNAIAELTLANEDRQQIVIRQNTSIYSYYHWFPELQWIANPTKLPIVIGLNDFKRHICVVDKQGHIVMKNQYSIEWRQGNNNYVRYTNGALPNDGIIHMRITFPDNTKKTFSFFYISDSLNITSSRDIPETWRNGGIMPIAGNLGNEIRAYTKYRFQVNDSPDYIDVDVINKLNNSCFISAINGDIIPPMASVAFKDLSKYRIYFDNPGNSQIEITFESLIGNLISTLTRHRITVSQYDTFFSLSRDEIITSIEKCFRIYGYHDKKQYAVIRIVRNDQPIGNNVLRVYKYCYDSCMGEDNDVVIIDHYYTQLPKPISGLHLKAVTTSIQHQARLFDLTECPDSIGHYRLTEEMDESLIVFSSDIKRSIVPILFDTTLPTVDYDNIRENEQHIIEARDEMKRENIRNWEEELLNDEDYAWSNLCEYFCICKQYSLDYSCFNCFLALSNKPELQVMFVRRLEILEGAPYSLKRDDIVKELLRLQTDVGFAFFYIPRMYWDEHQINMQTPSMGYLWDCLNLEFKQDEEAMRIVNNMIGEIELNAQPNAAPNRFIGEFPSNQQLIACVGQQMRQADNCQQQLVIAKRETTYFAKRVSRGDFECWHYDYEHNHNNVNDIMFYNRWIMRMINYLVHYDPQDFIERFLS